MSLFEDERYRWRETYFVLFSAADRPAAAAVERALRSLGRRYEVKDARADEEGRFESVSLISPYDHSAMDVSFTSGPEVKEHVNELMEQIARTTLTDEERKKAAKVAGCNARMDVYHFEQVDADGGDADPDDAFDPGALLIVLESLAETCHGVAVDPQSGTVV